VSRSRAAVSIVVRATLVAADSRGRHADAEAPDPGGVLGPQPFELGAPQPQDLCRRGRFARAVAEQFGPVGKGGLGFGQPADFGPGVAEVADAEAEQQRGGRRIEKQVSVHRGACRIFREDTSAARRGFLRSLEKDAAGGCAGRRMRAGSRAVRRPAASRAAYSMP